MPVIIRDIHTFPQVPVEDSTHTAQSEVIQFSEIQSHSHTQNQDPDKIADSVILPNPSPRRGVCGSFLNRQPAGSPQRLRPAPSSPHAKQLEEVLARSTVSAETVQSSPLRVVGAPNGGRGVGSSPLTSVRRRLDLGGDKEVQMRMTYVTIRWVLNPWFLIIIAFYAVLILVLLFVDFIAMDVLVYFILSMLIGEFPLVLIYRARSSKF